MANNRMWLVHRPSQLGISLGKRMGWGWYGAPEKELLEKFYSYLSENYEGQDDFVLLMEDSDGSTLSGDWDYANKKEHGFMKFVLRDQKPS